MLAAARCASHRPRRHCAGFVVGGLPAGNAANTPIGFAVVMATPNIPEAKRAGLPVDLDRLAAEGDSWLTPEDRYALKTYGVCTQLQDHVFMVRVRVPGGVLPATQARGLARLARKYSPDWVHLTTRQNVEFHWVSDRAVPELLAHINRLGLTTRSACGHTLRNVMASEEAGVSLDEPFDCLPDARAVSDAVVARSATLNCTLPGRVNFSFGGSPRCRDDALLNDGGFVSVVVDGEAGYELWAGGSLGKAPQLGVKIADFVPRADVVAAAEALIDVYVAHGNFDNPAKGRLKFAVERLGADEFRHIWEEAFIAATTRQRDPLPPVEVLGDGDRVAILSAVPSGGWSVGVRPERHVGFATVIVHIAMGDLAGADLDLIANVADSYSDGAITLNRDQNVLLRHVAVTAVNDVRQGLLRRGLRILGEDDSGAVRACTGSAVCALGITTAPEAGVGLLDSRALARNSSLRVHVSGCPNSCAQHQVADIGLAGSKVRVGGRTRDGYQIFLGADLEQRRLGQVVGRVAAVDVEAATEAIVGVWESSRRAGETLGQTVHRLGADAVAAHLEATMTERWASGPELPDDLGAPIEDEPGAPVMAVVGGG